MYYPEECQPIDDNNLPKGGSGQSELPQDNYGMGWCDGQEAQNKVNQEEIIEPLRKKLEEANDRIRKLENMLIKYLRRSNEN